MVRRFRIGVSIAAAMLLAMPMQVAAAGTRPTPVADAQEAADQAAAAAGPRAGSSRSRRAPTRVRRRPALAKAAGGRAGLVFSTRSTASCSRARPRRPPPCGTTRTSGRSCRTGKITILADTITTGISRIRANHATQPSAYASGFTGAGVRVAILDTGIDLTHPDLVPNLDIGLGPQLHHDRAAAGRSWPRDPRRRHRRRGRERARAWSASRPRRGSSRSRSSTTPGQGEWSNLICAIDYLTGLATDGDPTTTSRSRT